jgi:hypothetical protein
MATAPNGQDVCPRVGALNNSTNISLSTGTTGTALQNGVASTTIRVFGYHLVVNGATSV